MGRETADSFGNDGARAYLGMLTAKLVATITEIIADDSRLEPDEDGESMLMPSVEVLALLCERYNLPPPKAAAVRQWASKYLHKFDQMSNPHLFDQASSLLEGDEDSAPSRRRVIEQTFRWLECLAKSYWST